MFIVIRNEHGDLYEDDCISYSTLQKGMNPIILPPTMGE